MAENEKNENSIEKIEILNKINQEDEIQNSLIKIRNNLGESNDENDRSNVNLIQNNLVSFGTLMAENESAENETTYKSGHASLDHSSSNYHSLDPTERELLKKYLSSFPFKNHIAPVVKTDLKKKFLNEDKIYPICSKVRGYCMIINNVNFKKVCSKREGSDLEAQYLTKIFKQLGFEILYYRDMTAMAMLECFKNLVTRNELELHDTFVSIILTHGDDDRILIGVNGARLKVDTILHLFTNSNCPKLAKKPKLFFIQACRGKDVDYGIYEKTTVSDAVPVNVSVTKIRKELGDPNRLNDVLVVYSTLSGFVSLRNEFSGSWFGDALGFALCEHAKDLDLQKLLLFVNRKIIEREKADVQQAIECNYIGFRKSFYFNPGHVFSKKSNQ